MQQRHADALDICIKNENTSFYIRAVVTENEVKHLRIGNHKATMTYERQLHSDKLEVYRQQKNKIRLDEVKPNLLVESLLKQLFEDIFRSKVGASLALILNKNKGLTSRHIDVLVEKSIVDRIKIVAKSNFKSVVASSK